MDQKDNLSREKTFYNKFKERILTKHEMISQTVDQKREIQKEMIQNKKIEEQEVLKKGPLLVTNYLDAYCEMKNKNPKPRKKTQRFKSLTTK